MHRIYSLFNILLLLILTFIWRVEPDFVTFVKIGYYVEVGFIQKLSSKLFEFSKSINIFVKL